MDNSALAINLTRLRKESGYTQQQLAKKLYITSQSVSKWENGESVPSLEILIELAKIFNVTLDELVASNNLQNCEMFKIKFCLESSEFTTNLILRQLRRLRISSTEYLKKYGIDYLEMLKLPEEQRHDKIMSFVQKERNLELLEKYTNDTALAWQDNKDKINKAFAKILGDFPTNRDLICIILQHGCNGYGNGYLYICPANSKDYTRQDCINALIDTLLGKVIKQDSAFSEYTEFNHYKTLDILKTSIVENSDLKNIVDIKRNNDKKDKALILEQLKLVYNDSKNLNDFVNKAMNFFRTHPQIMEYIKN